MKRVLVSLAIGLLIIPMLWLLLLLVKVFSPTAYPPAVLWIVSWPYPLLCRIPNISVTAVKVVVTALLGDYLILSFLAFLGLGVRARFLGTKVRS